MAENSKPLGLPITASLARSLEHLVRRTGPWPARRTDEDGEDLQRGSTGLAPTRGPPPPDCGHQQDLPGPKASISPSIIGHEAASGPLSGSDT